MSQNRCAWSVKAYPPHPAAPLLVYSARGYGAKRVALIMERQGWEPAFNMEKDMNRRDKRRALRAATDLAFLALFVGLAYAAIEQVVGYAYPEPLGYILADEYSRDRNFYPETER